MIKIYYKKLKFRLLIMTDDKSMILKNQINTIILRTKYYDSTNDFWCEIGGKLFELNSSKIVYQYLNYIKKISINIDNFLLYFSERYEEADNIFFENLNKKVLYFDEILSKLSIFLKKFNLINIEIYLEKIKNYFNFLDNKSFKNKVLEKYDGDKYIIKEEWNDRVKYFNKLYLLLLEIEKNLKLKRLENKPKLFFIKNKKSNNNSCLRICNQLLSEKKKDCCEINMNNQNMEYGSFENNNVSDNQITKKESNKAFFFFSLML